MMDDHQRDNPSAPPAVEPRSAEASAPADPAQPPAPYPPYSPYAPPASAPAYPSYPGYPAPGYPGAPSMPLQTGDAGTMPQAPQYPPYPGSPSMPLYGAPGAPSYPSYPTYPGMPGMPGMPSGPSVPLYPVPPAPTSGLRAALARGFPLWLTLVVGVVALAAVTAGFFLAELAGHADWADGARVAGIVALALAGIALIGMIVRLIAGRRTLVMALLSAALLLVLLASGVGGLAFTAPIHGFQAKSLESAKAYRPAIDEYAAAGEAAPNAPNIARVLDEWGEDLLAANQYQAALTKFSTVTSTYSAITAAVTRANRDIFQTYTNWVKAGSSDVPYSDAIAFFGTYASGAGCDSACQSGAHDIEAQARFQYGTQLASQSRYSDAIAQFETVQKNFAQSSFAAKAHASAATAYLALAKQQKGSDCSSAIPTYQTLAKSYSDTPEGKQATTDLAAPQPVSGTITNVPSQFTSVILASNVDDVNRIFTTAYETPLDASTGKYSFSSVAQGSYFIFLGEASGSGAPIDDSQGNHQKVSVGPLCPATENINLTGAA
jgi:tetratricopeptide (TPR) repeat protein